MGAFPSNENVRAQEEESENGAGDSVQCRLPDVWFRLKLRRKCHRAVRTWRGGLGDGEVYERSEGRRGKAQASGRWREGRM